MRSYHWSDSKYLESKLGTSPMSPLGIVPDGVTSPHPDPLGDGTVLLHLLGKFSFYAKSFQSGHFLLTYFLSEKMIILHYYLIGVTKL